MPTHLDGETEQLAIWVQAVTGLELDRDGGVNVLTPAAWQDRGSQLAAAGGPPMP